LKNLLIVDNSVVIINILKDLFSEKNDFKVYVAKSLKDVESLINKEEFFAVISNTVLPDALNGELLQVLKVNDIPTIILSSTIDNELVEASNNLNVIDYVLKDSMYGLEYIYTLVELLVFIKGLNVLVVRESRELSLRIKYILESLFLNVKIARNAQDALEIVENHSDISLIISDYKLPVSNALELTKKIRKNDKYSNIPILILSDEVDDKIKINLFKTGINDFIIKPILVEELKAKVINLFLNTKQVEEINTFSKIFDDNIISSSTDTKGVIKSVSAAFSKISGYTKEELIGKHHSIVRHPDMPSTIYEDLWGTIKDGKTWKGEIKNLRKDGSSYWVSAIIEPIWDKQKNKIGYYAIRQDITDKKRIYELSITDGLTSLYNRRYFNDIAKSIFDKTVRNNEVFGFMLLDVDNFKKYNDTYGHQEGDTVLISISNSLKKSFKRSDDLIFRLGGEEFGVLINAKKEEDILTLAASARENIEGLGIEHKKNLPSLVITASFGVVIIRADDVNEHSLDYIYKEADDNLYKAKENGRNKIEYNII
jgi:diguanylate cyclase (GGDEF)-like protein/PAS domain S-box-containing protein